jgi:hypothetical protein
MIHLLFLIFAVVNAFTLQPSFLQLCKKLLPATTRCPQLILVSGCTGVGKSTFAMQLALDHSQRNQGIVKYISTDSIRQILKTVKTKQEVPALFRSSYFGEGDPLAEWEECCSALNQTIYQIVDDAIQRRVSLIIEGVHLRPGRELIRRWNTGVGFSGPDSSPLSSGVSAATGIVLMISDFDVHRDLLLKRGRLQNDDNIMLLEKRCTTSNKQHADNEVRKQLLSLGRIRAIQNSITLLGRQSNWNIVDHVSDDYLEVS